MSAWANTYEPIADLADWPTVALKEHKDFYEREYRMETDFEDAQYSRKRVIEIETEIARRWTDPMHQLYQRDDDGYATRDGLVNRAYPPIPDAALFQAPNGYHGIAPTEIHGWQWSTDFGRWSALVTFACGWHGYTYPVHSYT